jgi:DNA invertase Pin-like site-specific DNA recombinase
MKAETAERNRLKKEEHAREMAEKRLRKVAFPISPSGLYGYLRVSTAAQAAPGSHGLPRQRKVVTDYCEENGFFVPHIVFIEEIASAYTGEHLKKKMGHFLKMAGEGKLGPATHLFMEAIDRFSRHGSQTWDLIDALKDAGTTLHFIWDNQIL